MDEVKEFKMGRRRVEVKMSPARKKRYERSKKKYIIPVPSDVMPTNLYSFEVGDVVESVYRPKSRLQILELNHRGRSKIKELPSGKVKKIWAGNNPHYILSDNQNSLALGETQSLF